MHQPIETWHIDYLSIRDYLAKIVTYLFVQNVILDQVGVL